MLRQIDLNLPEGYFRTEVVNFQRGDADSLFNIYKSWRILCNELDEMNARKVNLPEGLSESAFCLAKNMVRIVRNIQGANTSFDCYDTKAPVMKNRIQIKACSVIPDLTSFGPKSVWDRIFFLDFYREGKWDGTFDIYEINTDDIYNHKVNATQTLKDQQLQGRRPRFSIYKELIQHGRYISRETFVITKEGVDLIG
ncbi:Bsp6I family type II restriction endonuclease [Dethiothermospora halolimnae]|uniref:Bsp6I family type II restriction endonuclease n=1 Tax=Dethiothermospora halolimnae TaxID=3114390 RepID=UPI003CCB95E5